MLKHSIQINFRVNAEEQELLQQNAKKCGLSIAKYMRFLIRGYVPKEQPSVDYKTLIRELHAIGNSMNQIAARANTTGFIAADAYKKNVSDLQNTVLEIQKAIILPEKLYGDDKDMGG